MLKRLESAGLIERTRRDDDERSVAITLTSSGRALEAQSLEIPQKLNCALGLNDADTVALTQTLSQLTASAASAASG